MGWNPFSRKSEKATAAQKMEKLAEAFSAEFSSTLERMIQEQRITEPAKQNVARQVAVTFYKNTMETRVEQQNIGVLSEPNWITMRDSMVETIKKNAAVAEYAPFALQGAEYARKFCRTVVEQQIGTGVQEAFKKARAEDAP